MSWQINYYFTSNGKAPVKEWLDSIGNEPKAEIFRIFELLCKYGTELGLPFVMLHGFQKKTRTTPRKEIEIAQKRMKEIQHG